MRSRLIACVAAAGLLVSAGCSNDQQPAALPPVQVVNQPAASAGGACILWDYAFIKQKLGVTFTVAAAGRVDDAVTCVVQTEADAPFLALSVVDSVKADAELFTEDLMPVKATKVKGLGKAGYRLIGKPSGELGPSIEVGWLSEAAQLQTLRFTFAKGADKAAVDQMSARLIAMAKVMDTTKG